MLIRRQRTQLGTADSPTRSRRPRRRAFGLAAAALVVAAVAVVSPVVTPEPAAATTVEITTSQNFTVPAGVTSITATVRGAHGGNGGGTGTIGEGGQGGVVTSTFAVTPGETLAITLGARGTNGAIQNTAQTQGGPGFRNGGNGGGGGGQAFPLTQLAADQGGGGGGASAVVRTGPPSAPLIVAGGGGGGGGRMAGAGTPSNPGATGGNAGQPGTEGAGDGGAPGLCCNVGDGNGGLGGQGETGSIIGVQQSGGGGGGGGGGFDGGTGGGGFGGSGGNNAAGGGAGAGGGAAGGQSWISGQGVVTPTFHTGDNGSVTLVFQASTTTTLTSSVNPSFVGQDVTFTATVNPASGPTPTGTVTFFDGPTQVAGPVTLVNGVATFTTNSLPAGNHNITAVYNGSADHTGSTSNIVVQTVIAPVGALQLTAQANPVAVSAAGQTITYTATVTDTGNVAINNLAITDAPVAPAGPVSLTCTPTTIAPQEVATCTGTYTVSDGDIGSTSGAILRTFTATGTNSVTGDAVSSNPFSVNVDVRVPVAGWAAILVNTSNTIGLTP